MKASQFMDRFRVIFRFAPGAIHGVEGLDDLLDLDEAIAKAIGNPQDDPDAAHVMGTSEAWDDGFIFADVASKDPQAVLQLVYPWLERTAMLGAVVVASGSPGGPYTVMHPPDFHGPFESPLA